MQTLLEKSYDALYAYREHLLELGQFYEVDSLDVILIELEEQIESFD